MRRGIPGWLVLVAAAATHAQLLAAPPAPVSQGKPATPASQPSEQTNTIPAETLQNVFRRLHADAEQGERSGTPAGLSAALDKYRKMQQMIERFPEMRTNAAYRDLVAGKIKDLQPRVAANARQALTHERSQRQARAAARPAPSAGPRFVGGGSASAGGGSRGRVARIAVPRVVCPPGAARSGST